MKSHILHSNSQGEAPRVLSPIPGSVQTFSCFSSLYSALCWLGPVQSHFSRGFTPCSGCSLSWPHTDPSGAGLGASSTSWIARCSSGSEGWAAVPWSQDLSSFPCGCPWHGAGENKPKGSRQLLLQTQAPSAEENQNLIGRAESGLTRFGVRLKWQHKALNDLHGTGGRSPCKNSAQFNLSSHPGCCGMQGLGLLL